MQPSDQDAEDIQLFLEAVYTRYGYDLRGYAPTSMRRRVRNALARSGLNAIGDLRRRILQEPAFFAQVLENLTVRVSDMFRDPTFYRTFRGLVVPLLRTYPLLNIWHAGCATGEEVYSVAILLAEEGLSERTQIYATDLSPGALINAKEGVYPQTRLPRFDENYRAAGGVGSFSSYCTGAYERIVMRESLRRNVLFFQHDLVTDQAFGEMHVIFCRNVLIYFNPTLRQRVLQKFAESVYPGGFLCLGSAERLPRTNSHQFASFVSEEHIYQHRPFLQNPPPQDTTA
ncbi:MAG: protein-glutamate O-methyltransferase CheR [Verrucomicrobiota bacterium]